MSCSKNGIRLASLMVFLCSLARAQAPPPAAPVVLEGRTLLVVHNSLGPFSAQERAAATSERLIRVAKDLTASLAAITAISAETSTDITLGDRVLLTVTDADASAAGKSRAELVTQDIALIQTAVSELREEYSSRSLLKGTVYTLLITALLIALLVLLRKLRSVAARKVGGIEVPPVRIQRVELISSSQIKQILIQAVIILRLFLILAALYVYVPLVLSLFPWTREYAPKMVEYIIAPLRSAGEAILAYLPSLFVVIICAAGAYLLIRAARFLFREIRNGTIVWPGFYREWAGPTYKIVRFLILAVTLVVVFPYLPGSSSPAFRGVSIFLGVLFSLGSTSAVANVIGGVILTYTRAFRVGDRVKIADTIGDVIEKSLLATRIRTIKNEFVTVPNSMVLGSHIINYSSNDGGGPLILYTSVTIGYDTPWRTVHALLITAALRTSNILQEPEPFVLQTSLDDYYVSYQINAYTSDPSRMAVTYGELHQNIQDCFNEAGVEIMSPHYTSLRDGNLTTVPTQYLSRDYFAPPFGFEQNRQERGAGESK